jgi:hypothetical protein
MRIHLARQSSQLGVFSAEEVAQGLASGRFLPTDLAWRSGMPTWAALSEWHEFESKVTGPLAGDDFGTPQAVSVPWELGRSLQSYWATVKGAILSPGETLAVGKYAYRDYILFLYVTLLLTLPFTIFAQLQLSDSHAQVADFLRSFDNSDLNKAAESLMSEPVLPAWTNVRYALIVIAIYPVFVVIFGYIQRLALRVFRQTVTAERSIVSAMIGVSVSNLIGAPLMVLSGEVIIYYTLAVLITIPLIILSCRAQGAVMRIKPWFVFGSWVVMAVTLSSCCCCFASIMAMLSKSIGLK